MRRYLVPLALAVSLLVTPAAHASRIKSCGNADASARNVTTRNLSCPDARRFARAYGFVGYGNTTLRRGGYTCRHRIIRGSWFVDVRCTRWIYVIRWQYSSGE